MIVLGLVFTLAGIAGIMWLTFPVILDKWRGLMIAPIFMVLWLGGMAIGAVAAGGAP